MDIYQTFYGTESNPPQLNPAEYISRNWYKGMSLTIDGVNFGEVMTYDTLQIVNRNVMQTKAQTEQENAQEKPKE